MAEEVREHRAAEADSGGEAPGRASALVLRALLLLGLALLGIWLARATTIKDWLEPAGDIARRLQGIGWWSRPAFAVAMGVLVFAGVPRLLFCPLAGAAFGFWSGLAWSLVGTMLSYYGGFLFVRGRARVRRASPMQLPPRLAFLGRDPRLIGVIIARLMPLPGMVITTGLALSAVSHGAYLLGSLIGLIPEAAPLVLLGTGLLQERGRHVAFGAVGAVVLLAIGAWIIQRVSRQGLSHRRVATPAGNDPSESSDSGVGR